MAILSTMTPLKRNLLLGGVTIGSAYGLVAYFFMMKLGGLPTVAFLALVPLAMGAIPQLFSDEDQVKNYLYVLFAPWLSIAGVFMVLFATLREATLCLLILGSPFILAALLGTLIATVVRGLVIRSRKRKAVAATLMLLPFVFLGLEKRYLVREQPVEVRSSTVVTASAQEVFDHLAEFDTIRSDEYQPGFFNQIGVPRPIRATVDHKGLGGHRTGVFERGLVFREVITEYDAPHTMAFSIDVDPTVLATSSTERHALENGYFRFVDARYQIGDLGDGRVQLDLSSTYVAKSSVNAYGELWASAIIEDFQDRVLGVLQRRLEKKAAPAPREVASRP